MKKKTAKNNENGKQETSEGIDLSIKPAGAIGWADTILLALVKQTQPNADGEEWPILYRICTNVVDKAMTGDIEASKLVFDRVSGAPVQPFTGVEDEEELNINKELETEIGIC